MKSSKRSNNLKVLLGILVVSGIVISILLVIVGDLQNDKVSYMPEKTMEVIVTPRASRLDLDELNKRIEPERLYLAKNYTSTTAYLPPVDVYLILPPGSSVYYYSQEANALDAEVKIDGSIYLFSAEAGGRAIEEDFNFVKEEVLQLNGVSIKGYRVFMKDANIVMIGPDGVSTEDFYFNNLKIRKKSPEKVLSQDEKRMWEEMLNTIQTVTAR